MQQFLEPQLQVHIAPCAVIVSPQVTSLVLLFDSIIFHLLHAFCSLLIEPPSLHLSLLMLLMMLLRECLSDHITVALANSWLLGRHINRSSGG